MKTGSVYHVFVTLDRSHTIYVASYSRGFSDVLRVLIADAWSIQASAAILHYVTYLPTILCCHRYDARQDEFRRRLNRLHYLIVNFKNEVMTRSVVSGQPKKHANTRYKATKHIECTFFPTLWLLLVWYIKIPFSVRSISLALFSPSRFARFLLLRTYV